MKIQDEGFQGPSIDGQRTGKWTLRYDPEDPNSALKKEAHYENGRLHGLYAEYWKSGFRMYCNFVSGVAQGTCKYYYENGQVRYSGQYLNGEKQGQWHSFTATGVHLDRVEFNRGMKVGYAGSAYDRNWKEPVIDFKVTDPI
ncbi:MAG: hypothetical protein AAF570_00795 [Bacteroidota bacterium]